MTNKSDKDAVAPPAPSGRLLKDKKGRFVPDARGKTRKAIEMMANEGIDDTLAAQRSGVRIDNLRRALKLPANKAYINQAIMDVRQNAGQRAFVRNVKLSQTSDSDHVKADLNKWIAGVDNIAPIKRVEGRMTHTHAFEGFDFDPVDVTPTDTQSPADDEESP